MAANSVVEHLRAQSGGTLSRLYTQPSTCLAVVRLLSKLTQTLVFRLLYIDDALPMATVRGWMHMDHQSALDEAVGSLRSLRIIKDDTGGSLRLVNAFQEHLRAAITNRTASTGFDVTLPADVGDAVTADDLDRYAKARWEAVLHFMLRIDQETRPSNDVVHLLERAQLILSKAERRESPTRLTAHGFQFLLQGAAAQLWTLLQQYMGPAEDTATDDAGVDRTEVLNFLFLLGTLRFGTAYELASPAPPQRKQLLAFFADLGLVYQAKPGSRRFWPTRLALTLTSANTAAAETHMEGFIVLETNFDLYAYTDSPLQIAILNLFVTLEYRFPNMVKGAVRRESVRRAYEAGITSEQILHYLQMHAHPQLRKRTPAIPSTVSDQIRLWQMERDRLHAHPAVMFRDFASAEDAQRVAQYARDLGVLLYESTGAGTPLVIVSAAGNDQVRAFVFRLGGARAAA